jgi:hypothetical protein
VSTKSETVTISIIGVPIACEDGVKESWREVAGWAAEQLLNRFGAAIHVQQTMGTRLNTGKNTAANG